MTTMTLGRPRRKRKAAGRNMPLGGHLRELRRRLSIAAVTIVVAMIVAFIVTEPIITALTEPIRTIAATRPDVQASLNFGTVTSGFDLRLRIAWSVALLVAAPVWLLQIWLFVVPALTRKEKRVAAGFLVAIVPLFFGGAFTGWLVAPHAIEMMASFVPEGAAQFLQSTYYFDFILKLVLAVGVAFVIPVFLVLLNVLGVISGRAILRGWRVAVLIATMFSALATPSADVVSMLLLAVILIVLYLLSAGVALLLDRRRSRRSSDALAGVVAEG